jgi:hypothetical protein
VNTVKRYSKAVAPVLGLLAQPAVLGLLHGNALTVAELLVTAAVAAGVVKAPANAPKPASRSRRGLTL